ncbi:Condensin complex component cnd3 [Pyrenophora tritici-repentis]|nr:Condensin complex component cnd3 [Pyrenophora tritici-repentis]KAI0612113.1 Condensin complex component cnd3 [Pyrenophora tritici-repentis]KAI1538123.1 YCG1 Chromosome condensation complex Condensin subunit G [Pyrenophora tritici-repentis]KAI1571359.1 YCG1 Chromosome condensation complex Condensin subunit G [Pyrenophora tritici-repentis]KAI1580495.1 YCG1 Chromosome condensation complex Condensin subunit G [Pyrenophora tritici-repentis]
MPGRPSTRAPRASATSTTRKTSAGTTKSTRASSARQSANAIEIPDEGPVTTLRTQIVQVFSDAQKTTATQRKLVVNLRKIQEACCFEPPETGKKGGKKSKGEEQEDFDEEEFNAEVVRCVLRIMCVKKSEPVGDRVIRFLGVFLKHASEKDQSIFAPEAEEEEATAFHETPSSRLTSHILTTILALLTAKDKTIRFRATQTVAHIVNSLTTIDDDIFNLIRLGFLKRLRDKEPSVRVQAILGLGRLAGNDDEEQEDEDSDDEAAGGILDKLLDIMINDPSAEVRRAVLLNLPLWPSTLRYILERARDMDATTRRLVYGKILPALGDFRHMSLVEREKLIRWGLRDRDDIVRKAAATLFRERWLEDCASSRDTRSEEEKKPGDVAPPSLEALCELLERIDVTRSGEEDGMAHEAMRQFWDGRPDYRKEITFDHEFWNNLDAQTAFIARTLNDYAQSTEDERVQSMVEDKMPEVTMFAFVLQRELNSLMELVDKVAVMEENDPEVEEAQEDVEEQDFIVQQLLHIAHTLDYTDEMGRRQMYNIMREAIAKAQLPEECTKLSIEVLRKVCGSRGESDFCALIVEAIADVRDSLLDADDATVTGEDGDEESFHSAQSDVDGDAPLIKPKTSKASENLTDEEKEERQIREVMVYSKCLHIAQCTLQNVEGDLESDTSLTNILNTLIIPAVQAHQAMIRERGVICLGLAALLSKDLADNNLDLFFHCFIKGHDALKEIVIQVLTDVIITHPTLLTPTIPDPDASTEDAEPITNPRIRPITKILLKAFTSDNKRISLISCTAASKLLLLGILPPLSTTEVLKVMVLTYFDPETALNPALRQALSYFLPVFCHSKLKNAKLMADIAVPVISKLLIMRDENVEDEDVDEMVGWPVITAHLAEWTDGRKVVGATELGLDGKTNVVDIEAEEPHVGLAVEVLERALTATCSKDERKPLLSLLSKLFIAPSSSSSSTSAGATRNSTIEEGGAVDLEEMLHTLHGLVTEAVEGKIGTDATQRNALAKLETSLTKRLGEVAQAKENTEVETTQQGSPETTVAADAEEAGEEEETEVPVQKKQKGEGESMAEHSALTVGRDDRRRTMVTEEDIMEDLLQSEMSDSA